MLGNPLKLLSGALLGLGLGLLAACVATGPETAPANPPSPPQPQHRIGIVNALGPPTHAHRGFVVFSNFYDPMSLPLDVPRWAVFEMAQALRRNGHQVIGIPKPRATHDPAVDDAGVTLKQRAVMDDSLPELAGILQANRLDYLLVVYAWNSSDRFAPNSNFVLKNYGLYSFTNLDSSGAGVYANVDVDVVGGNPARRITTIANGNLACKSLKGLTVGLNQHTFDDHQQQMIVDNIKAVFQHVIENVAAAFPASGAAPPPGPDRVAHYSALGCDYDPVSSLDGGLPGSRSPLQQGPRG